MSAGLEDVERIAPEHPVTPVIGLPDVDAPQRQYVALIDGAIVGWVGSIAVDDATWTRKTRMSRMWCQNMYVQREFRRRGIAPNDKEQVLEALR